MGVEGGGSSEPLQAAQELGEPSSGLCSQVVTHDMADAPVLQGQKSLEMTQQCPWLSEVPVATSDIHVKVVWSCSAVLIPLRALFCGPDPHTQTLFCGPDTPARALLCDPDPSHRALLHSDG